jgi:hypothetical protein
MSDELPYKPFPWDKDLPGAAAIQACWNGTADEVQQRKAMETIVTGLCGYYDLSYRPSERDTAFAEGKRFVGAQLVKLTKLNYSELKKKHG